MATETERSVSGLCLMARPEHLDAVVERLREFLWLEIHAREDATGRLIVVQEHVTVEEHKNGLRELQAIPHVLTADLVVHHTLSSDDEDAEYRRSE